MWKIHIFQDFHWFLDIYLKFKCFLGSGIDNHIFLQQAIFKKSQKIAFFMFFHEIFVVLPSVSKIGWIVKKTRVIWFYKKNQRKPKPIIVLTLFLRWFVFLGLNWAICGLTSFFNIIFLVGFLVIFWYFFFYCVFDNFLVIFRF